MGSSKIKLGWIRVNRQIHLLVRRDPEFSTDQGGHLKGGSWYGGSFWRARGAFSRPMMAAPSQPPCSSPQWSWKETLDLLYANIMANWSYLFQENSTHFFSFMQRAEWKPVCFIQQLSLFVFKFNEWSSFFSINSEKYNRIKSLETARWKTPEETKAVS